MLYFIGPYGYVLSENMSGAYSIQMTREINQHLQITNFHPYSVIAN